MIEGSRQDDCVTLHHPSHLTDTLKVLSEFREEGTLCDVTILVDGKTYPAHKNVLASCSDYFKAMFTGGMRESRQSEIVLESISSDVFEQILKYIYEGSFSIEMMSALDLLHASSMLVLLDMQKECIKYLHKNINSKNCFSIRGIGNLYSPTLVKDSDDFISKNFELLIYEKEVLSLSHRELLKLLSSDEIVCKSEDAVSEVVEKWLNVRSSWCLVDVSSLLKTIRFPYLSEAALKCLIATLHGIDAKTSSVAISKNSPDAQYVKSLKNEYKLQTRKNKKGLACRTCQSKVSVVLCVSLRGDVYCYHLSSKRFRKLERFPHNWQPSHLIVNDDIVYATGSSYKVGEGIYTSEVNSFNPIDGKWTTLKKMSKSRAHHCAAFLDGCLYMIGGRNERLDELGTNGISTSVECYNTNQKVWCSKAPTKMKRIDSAAVATNKHIYVIGGSFLVDYVENSRSVERYDPVKDAWETMPPLNKGRFGCSAVYMNDKVFVFGGMNSTGILELFDFEYFDIVRNQWVLQTIPYNKPVHAVFCLDEKIIVSVKSSYSEDIFLQYSFFRRNGIKHERLNEFIHPNHKTSSFRYAVTKMLNYDIDKKPDATCHCSEYEYEEQSSSEDEFMPSSDDDDDFMNGWIGGFQPFGMFI